MSSGLRILLLLALVAFFFALRNLGTILLFGAMRTYGRGQKDRAIGAVERALKFPMGPQHRLTSAFLLLKEGHLDRAEAIIAPLRTVKTKKYNPNKARVYYSLVQWKRGELDRAVENLEGLLAEGYRTGTLYANLGYFLIEQGSYERALEVNREGLDYDSSYNVIKDNLGLTYIKLGEWDKALEIYEDLLTGVPSFPDAYYNKALIHIHRGETEEARDLLLKAETKNFSYLSTLSREQISSLREELISNA